LIDETRELTGSGICIAPNGGEHPEQRGAQSISVPRRRTGTHSRVAHYAAAHFLLSAVLLPVEVAAFTFSAGTAVAFETAVFARDCAPFTLLFTAQLNA
jgi:hypothetical protein